MNGLRRCSRWESPESKGVLTGVAQTRETVVRNPEGLHFRPIMRFVDLAARFSARLTVYCEERRADGRSPMELLMLVATQGARLRLEADGADAEQALAALVELIDNSFDEPADAPDGAAGPGQTRIGDGPAPV